MSVANGSPKWTLDSLYEFLERLIRESDRRYNERFNAQERAVEAALLSARSAVEKAEAESREWRRGSNEWRDAMNEWRDAMSDKDARFLTREEADARFMARDTRITTYETAAEKRFAALEKWQTLNEGRSGGLNTGWGYLLGAVGLASLVIGIVLSVT